MQVRHSHDVPTRPSATNDRYLELRCPFPADLAPRLGSPPPGITMLDAPPPHTDPNAITCRMVVRALRLWSPDHYIRPAASAAAWRDGSGLRIVAAAAARSSTSCAMPAAISAMTLAVTSPARYAARCGVAARPVAFWVRPTALATVVRIATPAAVPSWRAVLNRVEA